MGLEKLVIGDECFPMATKFSLKDFDRLKELSLGVESFQFCEEVSLESLTDCISDR